MSSDNTAIPELIEQSDVPSHLDQTTTRIIPLIRRDIKPSNVVLSAADLKEFTELLSEANNRSRKIDFQNRDVNSFPSDEAARDQIHGLMPIEYDYLARNGDSVKGLGIPNVEERAFPEELNTIFISNASFAERAIKERPRNTVEVFIAFHKPTLKMDLLTLLSNPTENRSIINVAGSDEAWVIDTTEKLKDFLRGSAPLDL